MEQQTGIIRKLPSKIPVYLGKDLMEMLNKILKVKMGGITGQKSNYIREAIWEKVLKDLQLIKERDERLEGLQKRYSAALKDIPETPIS